MAMDCDDGDDDGDESEQQKTSESDPYEIYYSEDFQSYLDSNLKGGWEKDTLSGSASIITTSNGIDQVLELIVDNTTGAFSHVWLMQEEYDRMNEQPFYFQADVKGSSGFLTISLYGTANNKLIEINIPLNGMNISADENKDEIDCSESLEQDLWNTVNLYINPLANEYNLSINSKGTFCNDLNFIVSSDNSKTMGVDYIRGFSFLITPENYHGGEVNIDHIRLYREIGEEIS